MWMIYQPGIHGLQGRDHVRHEDRKHPLDVKMAMTNPRIPFVLSSDRAALPALDGKRILVHLVVNVEHWQFDQPMPRTIVTPPHGRETVPDVPNFS
jgi:hypothetical protein